MSRRLPRSDREYLKDIVDATSKLTALTRDMNHEAFAEDWRTHHAAFSLLEILGEAAGRLSDEFRSGHPEVPWTAMRAMRNVLIHGYADVRLEAVRQTLEKDIPAVSQQVMELLRVDQTDANARNGPGL